MTTRSARVAQLVEATDIHRSLQQLRLRYLQLLMAEVQDRSVLTEPHFRRIVDCVQELAPSFLAVAAALKRDVAELQSWGSAGSGNGVGELSGTKRLRLARTMLDIVFTQVN